MPGLLNTFLQLQTYQPTETANMSSLASTLGLQPTANGVQPPSYGAHYLIFHFIFAYAVLSTRPWKFYYKIDHQVSPREDLTKYGPEAVRRGKLTQAQLDQIKRVDSCSANSVEHFTLFTAAILLSHIAGVETSTINRIGFLYTVTRALYAISYIFITKSALALSRGVFWWTSNILCIRLLWVAGKTMNAKSAFGI